MKIILDQVGKRFNRQWLFRNISFTFEPHHTYAVTGNNGSGKSTLLQMIYGFQSVSSGIISHTDHQQPVATDQVYRYSAFAAPYLELLEELTPEEMFAFHFRFRKTLPHLQVEDMLLMCGLEANRHKQIRLFSSGMKQRMKLALAFWSDTPVLLLDEPCSNLDAQGIAWYSDMMKETVGKRTVIIASNQHFEYDFCDAELSIVDYQA